MNEDRDDGFVDVCRSDQLRQAKDDSIAVLLLGMGAGRIDEGSLSSQGMSLKVRDFQTVINVNDCQLGRFERCAGSPRAGHRGTDECTTSPDMGAEIPELAFGCGPVSAVFGQEHLWLVVYELVRRKLQTSKK